MFEDDPEFIRQLISEHGKRYRALQLRVASQGHDAPVLHEQELREIEETVERLQKLLDRDTSDAGGPTNTTPPNSRGSGEPTPANSSTGEPTDAELTGSKQVAPSATKPPPTEYVPSETLHPKPLPPVPPTVIVPAREPELTATEQPASLKAYIVLAGGGIKGIALVGALEAASDQSIDWLGFGGASAGAIVATLAAVGYSPAELRSILTHELDVDTLLSERGKQHFEGFNRLLEHAKELAESRYLVSQLNAGRKLRKDAKDLFRILSSDWGFDDGTKIIEFLRRKIVEKLPALSAKPDLSFADLENAGARPLKIIASDITTESAMVFPDHSGREASVLDAVRASMSFPIAFTPLRYGSRVLVDGGLCSNLPVFLFDDERLTYRIPIFGVDLGREETPQLNPATSLPSYMEDLVNTAFEGNQKLLRQQVSGVHYVRISLHDAVGTFDFALSESAKHTLYQAGYTAMSRYLHDEMQSTSSQGLIGEVQSRFGVAEPTIEPVLRAIASAVEEISDAENIRSCIMLPTLRGTRIVTYAYGMDDDQDRDLELNESSGASGIAFTYGQPVIADLSKALEDPSIWGMTPEQQAKIPHDRKAIVVVPIFGMSSVTGDQPPVIGTLSVDTTTEFADTFWSRLHPDGQVAMNPDVLDSLIKWANILSTVLS